MALRFPNLDDHAIYKTASLPPIASFTAMFWARIDVNRAAISTFFKFGNSDHTSYLVNVPAANLQVGIGIGGSVSSIRGTTLVEDRWYHLAVTVSGTGADQYLLYVNGVLDVVQTGSTVPTQTMMSFGDWSITGFEPIDGSFEGLIVYDHPLTAAEVKRQVNQIYPVKFAGLNAFSPWRSLEEMTVNYAHDHALWTVVGTHRITDGSGVPWIERRAKGYLYPSPLYTSDIGGTVVPSAEVVYQVNKVLAGAAAIAGLVVKRVNKGLGGSVGTSGAVTVSAAFATVLNGALGVIGFVGVAQQAILSGAITMSGNVVKQMNRVLISSLFTTGDVVVRVSKVIGGTVTGVGSLVVGLAKAVVRGGTITPSSGVGGLVSLFLAGSSDALRSALAMFRRRRR